MRKGTKIKHTLQTTNHWQTLQTTNQWETLQTTKWSTDCGATNRYACLKNAMSKQQS